MRADYQKTTEQAYKAQIDAKEFERFGSRFATGGYALPLPDVKTMRAALAKAVK